MDYRNYLLSVVTHLFHIPGYQKLDYSCKMPIASKLNLNLEKEGGLGGRRAIPSQEQKAIKFMYVPGG